MQDLVQGGRAILTHPQETFPEEINAQNDTGSQKSSYLCSGMWQNDKTKNINNNKNEQDYEYKTVFEDGDDAGSHRAAHDGTHGHDGVG